MVEKADQIKISDSATDKGIIFKLPLAPKIRDKMGSIGRLTRTMTNSIDVDQMVRLRKMKEQNHPRINSQDLLKTKTSFSKCGLTRATSASYMGK